MEFDLVLLHPPSFYDFRKNNQFRDPISDVVPSCSVFDMYPIGFTSIAEYLQRKRRLSPTRQKKDRDRLARPGKSRKKFLQEISATATNAAVMPSA
jgi:hypothetical protein